MFRLDAAHARGKPFERSREPLFKFDLVLPPEQRPRARDVRSPPRPIVLHQRPEHDRGITSVSRQ